MISRMKRYYIKIAVVLMSMLLLNSCDDDRWYIDNYTPSLAYRKLSIDPLNLNFGAEKETGTLNVTAQDASWKFTANATAQWARLSPISGNSSAKIVVSVDDNFDPTTSRTALWQFSDNEDDFDYTRNITVTQGAAGYFARPANKADETIQVSATRTTRSIGIVSNGDWTPECDQNWVQCTKNGDNLSITVQENTSTFETDRVARVNIICNKNNTSVVTVVQNPPKITAKTEELHYSSRGGTYSLSVESEVAWKTTTSATWLTVSPSSANAGKTTLTITAAGSNSVDQRTANVYIKVGEMQKYQIPIRQDGLQISVSKTSLSYGYKASSQTISVTSDVEWNVVSKPDFVTSVTPASSQAGTKSVQIAVSANTGGVRTGEVVLGNAAVSGLSRRISITQEGATMQASETEIILGSVAGSKHEITLSTNDDWTAKMQTGTWASVSPTGGSGTATVTVTAQDNPTLQSRTDVLVVQPAMAQPILIAAKQEGRYLRVDKTHLAFFVLGGKETLTVSTDGTFKVESNVSWAKVSTNAKTITVEVSQMVGNDKREGKLIITMTDLQEGSLTVEVPVSQQNGQIISTENFTEDECWNLEQAPNVKFTVTGFSTDNDWSPKHSTTQISVTSFDSDTDWSMK